MKQRGPSLKFWHFFTITIWIIMFLFIVYAYIGMTLEAIE